MEKININLIPDKVRETCFILENAGFEAWIVGGCVRDLLIDRTPKDWDITTNANPDQIQSLFTKTIYENAFGTVFVVYEDEPLDSSVRLIDVTPFRTETTYTDFRHPDQVTFAQTIDEDLGRRDFTMNAIALRLMSTKGQPVDIQNDMSFIVKDNYNGLNDIKATSIRAVGDPIKRFTEDALRMVRAIRFASELGFTVSHETSEGITTCKDLVKHVSHERIHDEFVKIVDSANPAMGIMFLVKLGLMEHIIPELLEGVGCHQGGAHIYDVFEHLVHALQHGADKGFPFHVKLAALFHDIGKPRTKREGKHKPTFYGHEVVGARMTAKIMERLKFPKKDTELVTKFVRWHMFFSDTEQITLSAVRRMIANVGKEHIWELMQVRECDRVGMKKAEAPYRLRKYHAMIEECLRDPISVSQLAIDGNYLMNTLHVKPGPRMGWMLHAMLEEVLEDPTKNTIEKLSDRVKQFEEMPDAELKALGEKGKQTKEEADEEEIKKLHVKHGVK